LLERLLLTERSVTVVNGKVSVQGLLCGGLVRWKRRSMAEVVQRTDGLRSASAEEPTYEVSEAILDALRTVYDPCCKEKEISVVDMGLIESVHLDGEAAKVELVLTSGWCPFAVDLLGMIQDKVESLSGVQGVEVEIVWDKAWSPARLSKPAREKLRWMPPPAAVADREAYIREAREHVAVNRRARAEGAQEVER
jgi:metal-sulfur cluster biosynthetic enzyme